MKLKFKFLSVLMAGCVLASNISAQTRSVLSLSGSSKRYGITANYRWWIDYSAFYRNYNSKITTTDIVSEISAGIYVYRVDTNVKVGEEYYNDENNDECEVKYAVLTTAPLPALKANASFLANNPSQAYPIVNIARTTLYVTEG